MTNHPLCTHLADRSGASLVATADQLVDTSEAVQYRVKDGILIHRSMTDLGAVMHAEQEERDRQVATYDKRLDKRVHKEINPTKAQIDRLAGGVVVEYGCGTGRFTSYLAERSTGVIAIDFSFASLQCLQTKLQKAGITNVLLIQADVTQVFFGHESIDLACSFQVYEHIPLLWQRQQWLHAISDSLRPNGRVYMTLYHHDYFRRRRGEPDTGFHSGGIFYQFYNAWQLRSEWYGIFGEIKIGYLDLRLPGETRFKYSGATAGRLSGWGSRLPFVRTFAHLITVETTKTSAGIIPPTAVGYVYPGKRTPQLVTWYSEVAPHSTWSQSHFSYQKPTGHFAKIKTGTTSVIDLTKTEDELWQQCRKKFIRQQITRGRRNGLEFRRLYESAALAQMYREFRQAKSLPVGATDIFAFATQYGVYHEGTLLAGGIFFEHETTTRAYALVSLRYQAADQRELIGQANRLLIWEALVEAKGRGLQTFDLGGLNTTPDDPLTEFKESFGGTATPQYYASQPGQFSLQRSLLWWWRRFEPYL